MLPTATCERRQDDRFVCYWAGQSFKPNDIRPHDLMTGMMLYGSQEAGRAMGLSARSRPGNQTSD